MLLSSIAGLQQVVINLISHNRLDLQSDSIYSYDQPDSPPIPNPFRPVVVWHGLGDDYNSSGIHNLHSILDSLYPGIYLYSIRLADDPSSDQQKSFLVMPMIRLIKFAKRCIISQNYNTGLMQLVFHKVECFLEV